MVDITRDVIPRIEEKADYFRKVRDGVYVTRCPFCGDTQSSRKKGHMYLLLNDSGCRCYCHKCNANVGLTNEVLTKFIGPHNFNLNGPKLRRINPMNPGSAVETDILDPRSPEYQYMKARLGCDFTPDELYAFRIIANQQKFYDAYGLKFFGVIPNTILFVTPDGNTLCYRSITDDHDFRWLKKKVYPKIESSPYVIRGAVDVLSNEEQTIIMGEGIFDVIGVYKNVMPDANLYMSGLGKDYTRLIKWMIGKGIFGKNFHIKIFSDNNVPASDIRKALRRYRWMYGSICIYYNDAADDFGVPQHQVMLRDPVII